LLPLPVITAQAGNQAAFSAAGPHSALESCAAATVVILLPGAARVVWP